MSPRSSRPPEPRALADHRRALWYAVGLLGSLVFVLFAVGRHPTDAAPMTTIPFVGELDQAMHRWMDDVRVTPLTWLFRFLNVLGAGIVTIPIRIVASAILAVRRRWRALAAFLLTWVASELILGWLKPWFHRGRPDGALVETVGFSFPSGHAVAGSALAVALVLAFMPAGHERRVWEWIAAGFAFMMALSRVYLAAHWFSDVVAGVLLGSGVAIGSAALVTEIRDLVRGPDGEPSGGRVTPGPG
ncbi:MAG: phosphatase PAP2 family protein [Actinomycetota bacterium]